MSDAPDREQDIILAGEYALGLLVAEEAAAFEARLAAEPELRALYREWAEDFAAMAEEVTPVSPPARVREGIRERLFPAPRKQGFLERFGAGGLAAAMFAVLLVLTVGPFDIRTGTPQNPLYEARIAAEDASLVIAATYDADGTLYVERLSGAARSGRALELWLIEGGNAPVSLGVLPEVEQAQFSVDAPLRARLAGAVLAISDEPPGGSPTGQPTGDVLAVGEITSL